MELKDQVCSLELATKLKELGVKQESLFYWVNLCDDEGLCSVFEKEATSLLVGLFDIPRWEYTEHLFRQFEENKRWLKIVYKKEMKRELRQDFASAFSVAELGERLPRNIYSQKSSRKDFEWACYVDESLSGHKTQWADTEANARAKMRIYLLEKKFIEEG